MIVNLVKNFFILRAFVLIFHLRVRLLDSHLRATEDAFDIIRFLLSCLNLSKFSVSLVEISNQIPLHGVNSARVAKL